MDPASVANGVRSFFGRGRHRYQPLPARASSSPDLDDDLDDDGGSEDDGLHDGRRRHTARARRGSRGRVSEPLLFAEPRRRRGQAAGDAGDSVLDSVWARGNRGLLKRTVLLLSFGLILYLGIVFSRIAGARSRRPSCDSVDHGYQCFPDIARSWGPYSPFFSVPSDVGSSGKSGSAGTGGRDPFANTGPVAASPAASIGLPAGCRYTFAQVLSRHGARDPTFGRSVFYAAIVARLKESVDRFEDGPDGRFAFLADYAYRLGTDQLNRFGERQMVHSGAHFYQRYRSLLLSSPSSPYLEPFVRAADQHRVVMSAVHWIQGFQAARKGDPARRRTGPPHEHDDDSGAEQHILLLPEAAGFNNTLSYNGLCKAFSGRAGTEAQAAFAATFVPPVTARLNRGLPGANLTDAETIGLMDLCSFDTLADAPGPEKEGVDKVAGGRQLSPFCHLFGADEWRAYDYLQTLGKWYGYGDGSALGATQGVGFVNELLARLTGTPVDDHTSTNRTLDASPVTFPLNATLYADFSHDNDMANVFAALGLYQDEEEGGRLQPSNTTRTEPAALRGFSASWAVPFAARLYVEKMVCDGADGGGGGADGSGEELVRVLVNDRVVPLRGCGADALGRCRLSRFVDSLAFARSGGRWDECFV